MVQPLSTRLNVRLSRTFDMEAFGMLSLDDMQAVCILLVQNTEAHLNLFQELSLHMHLTFNVELTMPDGYS